MSLYSRLAASPDEEALKEQGLPTTTTQPPPTSALGRIIRRLPIPSSKLSATLTLLVLSLGLNGLFLAQNALQLRKLEEAQHRSYGIPVQGGLEHPYTPIQDHVFYEYKKFDTFTQASEWVPPSDEVDKKWNRAWDPWQTSSVPRDQAKLLWNSTEMESGEGEPRYLVAVDVFHQLHCLDMIRQALRPDRYNHHKVVTDFAPPGEKDDPKFDHLDHCVNNIREAIMCNADLTTNVIHWDDRSKANWARLDVVHRCVNWDSVVDWAKTWKPRHKHHTNQTVRVFDEGEWKWEQPERGVKGW